MFVHIKYNPSTSDTTGVASDDDESDVDPFFVDRPGGPFGRLGMVDISWWRYYSCPLMIG